MTNLKTIGIITGGGDCAGLNAVISGIVKAGIPLGYEFIGFERGWEGLLDMQFVNLDRAAVRGISHLGGTILRTTNKGRFAAKVGMGDANAIDPDILDQAKRNHDRLGLSGLIVIGGDGTLSGAMQLADRGVNIVGVPKSIDNDLSSTDKTFGFSTAVQVAVDAIDKIHTTAASHDRVFFIECMGRHAGWISLQAGLAAGANAILLPEFDVNMTSLLEYLRSRKQHHKRSAICVVAEGIKIKNRSLKAAGAEVSLVGASEAIMLELEQYMEPDEFEMRHVVLGHTQRGGSPNAEDRILSKRYGVAAIEALHDGKYGHMVSVRAGEMGIVPILEAVGELKRVTTDSYEYSTAQKLGIYLN